MANCQYNYDPSGPCEVVATTTLKKNNGVIVPLCEHHVQKLIALFKSILYGEQECHREKGQDEAAQ
jgi:hypothetical protein